MARQVLTAIAGFMVLFGLYHAAEYMILFKGSAIGFLAFQFLFFGAAWLIAKWQSKPGFAAWGLALGRHVLRHLLLGMVMGILLYALTFTISLLLGIETVTTIPGGAAMIAPLGLFIFGNFFSSVSEDILTRGYVYNHLNRRISNGAIVIISATIYLLNHIYRLGDGIETHLYLFVLGVLFIIPLLRTKQLWFTSGMHWAGNVFFYFSHDILRTATLNKQVSPNYILAGVILVMIPLNNSLLRKFNLIK